MAAGLTLSPALPLRFTHASNTRAQVTGPGDWPALGRFWAMGGTFDWSQLWEGARRKRVALPTYAFQRKPYFIEPGTSAEQSAAAQEWLMRAEDRSKWGWTPFWKPTYADCNIDVSAGGLEEAADEEAGADCLLLCWIGRVRVRSEDPRALNLK